MPSHEPEDVAAEFYIDGEYTDTYGGIDLASRIRGNDAIRISRGSVDHQSAISPDQAVFTLNNQGGLFSTDNPSSPLFGKFGLNTRGRIGIKDSAGTWEEFVRMPDLSDLQTGQMVSTADKASLDITSDIDIRFEMTPYYTRGHTYALCGKWTITGNQRSWLIMYETDGRLSFWTSPDGTLTNALQNSTVPALPITSSRTAIRVTLDVNNGAGGRVYTYYTAPTIAGPWTLFATGTVAGTTSIFSGTSTLEVGAANGGSGTFNSATPFRGKIHAFELYSGIAGTLVADLKPAGKGIGTTSWADTCASPNTWTLNGDNIRLASDRIRISGEMTSLPEDWDLTGTDRWCAATMASILGRYQSRSAPLRGAVYRNYRNYSGITGGWAMEDETGASQAATFTPDAQPGQITDCTFGSTTGFDGTTGAITMTSAPNGSNIILRTKTVSNTGATSFVFYFRLDSLPASDQTLVTIYTTGGGTANRWTIAVGATGFAFTGYDQHGTVIDTGGSLFGSGASPLDQWIGMCLKTTQEGGNVRWETTWHAIGSDTFYSHFGGGDTYAGTMRQFQVAKFGTPDAAFAGAQIAHVIITSTNFFLNTVRFRDAARAYTGEAFGRRGIRLAEEEGVFFEWLGDPDETELMGPQPADLLFNIFSAGARADGGIFGSPRDVPGYRYASRRYLSGRRALVLDYSAGELAASPRPITDDRYTVNDFTANRPSGSSARYEATDDRPKNVRDPDDPTSPGVGRYERGESYATYTDEQLPSIAQFVVSLGTWPEVRIPTLTVGLHRTEIFGTPGLLNDMIGQDVADPVGLTGLAGKPLGPDDRFMLTFGYTEQFNGFLWNWAANTAPAGPYEDPVFNGLFGYEPRLDATGESRLHVGATGTLSTSATSLVVATPADEPAWADSTNFAAELSYDIKITGERMTATAVAVSTHDAMLISGTFESGVTGYDAVACTFTQSSTFAHAGTFSGRLSVVGSPTQAYVRTAYQYTPAVDEGDSVTLGVWVRSAVNLTDVRCSIDWLTADMAYISTSDSGAAGLLSASGWAQRTVTATAPAGARYAQIGPTILSSPSAGTLLYTDDYTFTNASKNYQTFTVTRNVNNIPGGKAHSDREQVFLFQQTFLGRE